MPETTQDPGKQMSFIELISEFQHVQIPIIQRDYAQGRPGHEELRRDFLSALKQALDKEEDDTSLPLDLDFVYGSGFGDDESTGDNAFAPLDGQQRLTTLFLLHWYLAWKDGRAEDFQARLLVDMRSRFSYEVRPSSHDFFNRLALNFPSETAGDVRSLRELIEDKSWFFRSWKDDPTIASALTMIDEIHDIFMESDGYYLRLIDPEHPRITFQLLELRKFGLSDDLYIKMNARGKALTPFESFKARLEQHLDELLPGDTRSLHGREVVISDYFCHRMDTAWTDLFWTRGNMEQDIFDEEIMRLINAMALVNLDADGDGVASVVSQLRTVKSRVSFSVLSDLGCLNKRMLETLVAVLDYWSDLPDVAWTEQGTALAAGCAAFYRATSPELSYQELTEFAAFCAFVRIHQGAMDLDSLGLWLRVICNLAENSDIERPSDFVDVLRSLSQLEPHADRVLEYFSEGSNVTAFSRQQVREERIKAALWLRGGGWIERILSAEQHGYFKGQIEFLLAFSGVLDHWLTDESISWEDEADSEAQKRFSDFLERSEAVFDAGGLRAFDDNSWERALLSLGDYTLSYGLNKSFLQDKRGRGERRPTWKLLLRGHMKDADHNRKRLLVKTLFEELDLEEGVTDSLGDVIERAGDMEPWRRMLVESPRSVAYCGQKMFRILDDGRVYLISRLRTSSEHVELWSYYMYHTLLAELREAGDLDPFTMGYVSANTEDYIPFVRFTWRDSRFDVDFVDRRFRVAIRSSDSESHLLWCERLEESFEIEKGDTWSYLRVASDNLEATIFELVRIARDYESR